MAVKKDKKPELVPIELFKDNGKYKDDVTVGLNGKLWRIKRGEVVYVPKEVREILDHSKVQDTHTSIMISDLENEFLAKEKELNS